MQSLSLYVFPALNKYSNFSIEASLKYFIYSSFCTGVFLLGLSIIYIYFGTLNFNEIQILLNFINLDVSYVYFSTFLIIVVFLFKLAIFPFHS